MSGDGSFLPRYCHEGTSVVAHELRSFPPSPPGLRIISEMDDAISNETMKHERNTD